MIQKTLIVAAFIFYIIAMAYLFLGLLHIGFPTIEKAEVIKGIFSFTTTVVSLFVAYLAYKAANKAAIATENAAESNRIAVSISEKSLFNATLERKLSVYKAMWDLNEILETINVQQGVDYSKPENNYVSVELYKDFLTLKYALTLESNVFSEPLNNKIFKFYAKVKSNIEKQLRPKMVKGELCSELDKDLIDAINLWKEGNYNLSEEIHELIKELRLHIKAP